MEKEQDLIDNRKVFFPLFNFFPVFKTVEN